MDESDKIELSFLPNNLLNELMPFQKQGIKYALKKSGRCLIADEMGLGKTLQAIATSYYYKDDWPLLIVVPASLRYPWIEEIEKWLPNIHPHEVNLIQSCSDISDIPNSLITIVTYGLLRLPSSKLVREALENQHFKVAIVDESHYMKNWRSATTKYLLPLLQGIERKILLSGTPALARPEELYPQINALLPNAFGNWTSFAKKYCDAHMVFFGKRRQWDTSGASNLEELQKLMSDRLMIRRLKKDVLKQLPPKQRQRIAFDIRDSVLKKDLESRWESLNRAMGRGGTNVNQVLNAKAGAPANFFEIRKGIMGLFQDTCKVKLGPVREYVKMLCANSGLKFLVFAHHHVMMDSMSEQLHEDKVTYIRIDGNTPMLDRPRFVKQFQSDPETRVALLSIQAAGVGLTLTAAQLVVFAELDWTPGKMEQAEDRAHRIGQQGTVHVHYLVAKGTLDEWLYSALVRKTVVLSTTLNGKTHHLSMERGQENLASCLANAEAFIPKPASETDLDVGGFFASQRFIDEVGLFIKYSVKLFGHYIRENNDTTDLQDLKRLKQHLTVKLWLMQLLLNQIKAQNQKSVLDYFTPKGKTPKKFKKKLSEIKGSADCIIIGDSGLDGDTSIGEFQNKNRPRKKRKRLVSDFSPSTPFCSEVKKVRTDISSIQGTPTSLHPRDTDSMLSQDGKHDEMTMDSCYEGSTLDGNQLSDEDAISNADTERENSNNIMTEGEDLDSICVEESGELNKSYNASQGGSNLEAVEQDLDSRWSCNACTLLNHVALPSCEMCSCPKPRKYPQRSRTKSKRTSTTTKDRKSMGALTNENDLYAEMACVSFGYEESVAMCSENTPKSSRSLRQNVPSPVENTDIYLTDSQKTVELADKFIAGNCTPDSPVIIDDDSNDCKNISARVRRSLHDMSASDEDININTNINRHPVLSDNSEKLTTDKCDTESMKSDENQNCPVLNGPSSGSQSKRFHFKKTASLLGTPEKRSFLTSSQHSNTGSVSLFSTHESCHSNSPFSSKLSVCPSQEKNGQQISGPDCSTPIQGSQNSINSFREENKMGDKRKTASLPESIMGDNEDAIVQQEVAAAQNIFMSPKKSSSESAAGEMWQCVNCYEMNDATTNDCDSCLETRPTETGVSNSEPKLKAVNLDDIRVHKLLKFCCSKNTNRIYLYDENNVALNCNFTVLDVEIENFALLPELLLHPENLRLVRRFVREWQSLSATKRRVIIKSGVMFSSPLHAYEELKGHAPRTTQRYMTKEDVATIATKKAEDIGGTTRVVARPTLERKKTAGKSPMKEKPTGENGEDLKKELDGIMQAVDSDGTPLCVFCHKPYKSELLALRTIAENPWHTRFCSMNCSDQYWMQRHRSYGAERVYAEEHGVCQLCNFDVNAFYTQLKVTTDLSKRALLIKESKFNVLKADIKEKMVKKPFKGLFWQVDHIRPVVEGGGQCDIDNLRTLCTLCHRDVTAQQSRDRAKRRKLQHAAANSCDITAFFKPV